MDAFIEALLAEGTTSIPAEYDWFAPLLGDWDFDYRDGYGGTVRQVKGEWFFRRVLDGMGIEDLFLCPSRATRDANPQPDGEYGAAIRMFNPAQGCYDMVYACGKYLRRLCFRRAGDSLVGTVLDNPAEQWVFSQIEGDTFRWQNITVLEDGTRRVNSDISARRRPSQSF